MKPLVVITGASSGIGEELAKHFSEAGHALLLIARRLEKLEALNLPNTMCKRVDVTDYAEFEAAVKEAEEKYGPVDCLINNAGLMQLGQFADQDPKEWINMYDVNVKGLMYGMKTVVNGMMDRKHGTIFNISSVAGKKMFPNHSVYCGTKFAVHAMSEAVREEVSSHNIRVITIAPGAVETELLGHTTDDEIISGYEDWKKAIGGALKPEDVANSIMFAYNQPQNVCLREIVLTATGQQA
ncbi:SDR family oxidoreductase [Aureibacter tunicatorum]|uniref:NADP-dependent 3-hydroxy acid dehydrogenase YdfG n=1 Tax=Aureibacter tunicatorum TaxID=866807 RepID=A0AAE4BU90_9BACT|nr:SDR family oxidoreductase [Aureibacter tunicatorum]MDR6240523.1 NADP-dependent 3-hydroxy acid dehydrogenase YdfG [Aureibacter tunicatorum]BDD06616.1 oxidoreductase [Aureibacter tunicatorum]